MTSKTSCKSLMNIQLTHFSPVSNFFTPWKRQKTFGFLTFSGGIEWNTRLKWAKLPEDDFLVVLWFSGWTWSFPIYFQRRISFQPSRLLWISNPMWAFTCERKSMTNIFLEDRNWGCAQRLEKMLFKANA